MKKLLCILSLILSNHARGMDLYVALKLQKSPVKTFQSTKMTIAQVVLLQCMNLLGETVLHYQPSKDIIVNGRNEKYPTYSKPFSEGLTHGARSTLNMLSLFGGIRNVIVTEKLILDALAGNKKPSNLQIGLAKVASIGITGLTYTASYFIKKFLIRTFTKEQNA